MKTKYDIRWECLRCHVVLKSRHEPLECMQHQGGCGKRANQTIFAKLFLKNDKVINSDGIVESPYANFEDGEALSQREFVCKDIISTLDVKTAEDNNDIYYYDSGIYHHDAIKNRMKKEVRFIIAGDTTTKEQDEIINLIRVDSLTSRARFNHDVHKIPLLDCVIDVRDRSKHDHAADFMFTYQLPVQYDALARCDGVVDIIRGVLPSEEDVMAFQEYLGYCLIRDTRFKKFMLLYGPKNTGKTTLLKIMWRLFGDGIDGLCKGVGTDNISNIKLQQICDPNTKYLLVGLYNRLLNIHDELPPQAIKDISVIKLLTGGSRLTVREIYGKYFSFNPFTKHVFTCNNLPQVHNDVEIFMDRLILMHTNHVFGVDNKDDEILQTIESELSGLVNWVLDGYDRLMSQNGFTLSKESEEVCKEYEFNANPLGSFCGLFMERDPEGWVIKTDFYELYCNWCDENSLSPIKKESVGRGLQSLCPGIRSTQRRVGEGGKSEHVWVGYRVKGYDEAYAVVSRSNKANLQQTLSSISDKSDDEWAAQ